MAARLGSGRGRGGAAAAVVAATVLATSGIGVAGGSAGARGAGGDVEPSAEERGVRVTTTGHDSERLKKLPISPRPGAEKRVVMSLSPGQLPRLTQGDRLRLSAELQVTVNCFFRSPRCVGPIYRYNPRVRARLILASSPEITGGPRALRLGDAQRDVCTQRHPHREHHCVLVFRHGGLVLRRPGRLPCPLDACYVNMVAEAHHPRARPGEVVLVGGNRPDGTIPQDRGRINAIRLHRVAAAAFPTESTSLRLGQRFAPDFRRRVVYSKRLRGLEEGEQLAVEARMRTAIAHLPYAVRTSARLILANSRNAVKQGKFVKKVALLNGEISESNGFNCTQDKGNCVTRKVGILEMKRDAVNGRGRPVPLFVNLVTVFGPKVLEARAGDRIKLRKDGGIRVTRFPAELNR
jgi:hypothetical protein